MKLDFRIDWGYQYVYSRRHYHPFYHWDGHLECSDGTIGKVFQLDYPVLWFGPGHCAKETPLDEPCWKSTTHRGLAGIRVEAEVAEGSTFRLVTLSGTFEFTVRDIIETGRVVFPVGPKYLGCHVIVTRTGYYWFLPPARPGQVVIEADALAPSVPVRDWARMRTAWIAPGETAEFEAELPEAHGDSNETVVHVVAMAAPEYTPGAERQIHDDFPIALFCDGHSVAETTRYLREHDNVMQMLEDVWLQFPAVSGHHRFALRNGNASFFLLVTRLTIQQSERRHLELSLPPWALVGEPLIGRVFAARADRTTLRWEDRSLDLELKPGWNDFRFSLSAPGIDVPVSTNATRGVVPAVYALKDETPEVTVGYDMTVVPHDDRGPMDWLLDYTWRTRLGNLVVFRSFRYTEPTSHNGVNIPESLLERWGRFCRDHRIHVEAATCYDNDALLRGAGEMMHSAGKHEWPGAVYAFDPGFEWRSEDMKTAMEHCLKRLKIEIDRTHKFYPRMAFGDASGGHRYCYMAGADFIRTETMVSHTQHLCSQARPAAEALGSGEWGVHIAIQHALQPYFENHLGLYYLSLFQPWMMGASMIYEEDSLFLLFKEERQAWDDRLTKGKRDMTRDFFRFVKTHPRKGAPTRRIAFVEGRYAAPFNGFICDTDQRPDYAVWGLFGKNDPLWGHCQPEKCRQLLDVLMPGASTQPLRQDYTKRRFFFSGTPYGDFDEVPTESKAEYLQRYSLLLHLGWNTMIQEDYDKLSTFVENGGTLLIGLPQFSRHVRREFLEEMMDLDLWNNGDLAAFSGLRVKGPGTRYSGQWNAVGREGFTTPDLSGVPSTSPDEDGPCRLAKLELAGAEPVVWDAMTGETLVTRFCKGRGTVYTVTAFAYPGHEALREVMAALIARLASQNLPQCRVADPSREVFWNEWVEDGDVRRLMLLNTDWTVAGNRKTVRIDAGDIEFETDVVERQAKILTVLPGAVLEPDSCELHLEVVDSGEIRCHGTGRHQIAIHRAGGVSETVSVDLTRNTTAMAKGIFPKPVLSRANDSFTVTWNNSDGTLASLVLNGDDTGMNWIEGTDRWGAIRLHRMDFEGGVDTWGDTTRMEFAGMREEGDAVVSTYRLGPIRAEVWREVTAEGLTESYVFTNEATYPVYFLRGHLGILATFNDSYAPASVSETRRCHAHIWCGGENSWVRALKMGPFPTELALVLQEGDLDSYSVRRIYEEQSNDRGDFVLHPAPFHLNPGTSKTIAWKVVAYPAGHFDEALLLNGGARIDFRQETVFPDETFEIDVMGPDGKTVHHSRRPDRGVGVYDFEFDVGGRKAKARGYCAPAFDDLVEARVRFIVEKQQCLEPDSPLYGAYLIWDGEDDAPYFDYLWRDHNACRERVVMALTVARWLQRHPDPAVLRSIELFEQFVLREFFDEKTCTVYDTIGKDPKYKRLYNAPNLVQFWRELYTLKKEPRYLEYIEKSLLDYYRLGGDKFYPNGCDFSSELALLEGEGRTVPELREAVRRHVANIVANGIRYPEHEVRFEQTIATPAVSILAQYCRFVEKTPAVLEALEANFDILSRFQGNQPDHRLHETAIRHWDGYWFGKRHLYGDTLHQHSTITARAFLQYAAATGDQRSVERAERCLRNCLYMFRPDGTATCAYMLPLTVTMLRRDGSVLRAARRGEFADPFVNDMDVVLYLGMRSGLFGE